VAPPAPEDRADLVDPSMLLDGILSVAAFLAIGLGVGLPLALRLPVTAAERLCAGIVFSLGLSYLGGFASFLAGRSPAWAGLLVPVAAVAFLGQRRALRDLLADPEVRVQLAAWAWLAGWGLALLAVVRVYSGGNLVGDWLEHYQRSFYYAGSLPPDYRFIGMYTLPARPPLTNVVTAVLLGLTRFDFAHFQFFMTLQGSLCLFPLALLARRFAAGPRGVVWILAVLLAINPLFAENLVYSWTKLQSAFFVLAGLAFLLEGRAGGSFVRAQLAFASLALGCLSHYSAGVYLVVLVALFLLGQASARPTFGVLRWGWAVLAAEGGAIFATWFPWSMHAFGSGTTYASNTTVASYLGRSPVRALHDFLLNTFNLLVPHFLRGGHDDFIATQGRWGPLRDFWFFAFQQELPLIAGFGGAVVLAWITFGRRWRPASAFWPLFVAGVIVLGVAVNDLTNVWGYAHICCQPLAYTTVALIAARWNELPARWRALAVTGYAADAALGIVLPFALQSVDLLDLVRHHGYSAFMIAGNYGTAGSLNLLAKQSLHLPFFADVLGSPLAAGAVAAGFLAFALGCVRRGRA